MGEDLDTVKSIFRRILWANKEHLTCERLLDEYKLCTGESFNAINYGYASLETFLESVADIIEITRGPNDELFLHCVEDETSNRIRALIGNQRRRKHNLKQKPLACEHQAPTDGARNVGFPDGYPVETNRIESTSVAGSSSKSAPPSAFISQRPGPKMDEGRGAGHGVGSGVGRARARMLDQALKEASASCQPGRNIFETPTAENAASPVSTSDTTVSDTAIKIWIIKELAPTRGYWAKSLPKAFEARFNKEAPADLLEKIRSWSDICSVETISGRDMLKLTNHSYPELQAENKVSNVQGTAHGNLRNKDNEAKKHHILSARKVSVPRQGVFFDIHIQWSDGPEEFCIIPYQMQATMNKMATDLNTHFQSATEIQTVKLQDALNNPGKVYAGNLDGTWYRVVVWEQGEEENTILASVPDCCYETKLPADQLAELPAEFQTLPFCGIKARLHGIVPPDGKEWPQATKTQFGFIVDDRDFVCLVCEKNTDDDIVSVRLVDTNDDEDAIVDDILEELNLIQRV